ncbi:uroporphyrin-III C-methyltransferase [Dinochytrium kinnereticum]|nr:uroporphyrin-III C-methyltransferase [Dinochytrium kinnereticum]
MPSLNPNRMMLLTAWASSLEASSASTSSARDAVMNLLSTLSDKDFAQTLNLPLPLPPSIDNDSASSNKPIHTYPPTPPPSPQPSPSTPITSHLLHSATPSATNTHGTITLVGAGPGDPSLLTLAGHTAILSADLIISDRLIPSHYLQTIHTWNPNAEIRVCRKPSPLSSSQTLTAHQAQEELQQWVVEAALAGRRVVRLKNGDPAVLGRTVEEVREYRCRTLGEVWIVPGVSSVVAAGWSLGFPVTSRGVSDTMVVTTGQTRSSPCLEDRLTATPPRRSPTFPVYSPTVTLVLLMSVRNLKSILMRLEREFGYPSDTPVAVVCEATMEGERAVLFGRLEGVELPDGVVNHSVGGGGGKERGMER